LTPNLFDLNLFGVYILGIANPAAGTNFTYSVPDNHRTKIALITYTFVTDANVAQRYHTLTHVRAAAPLRISSDQVGVSASKTQNVMIMPGAAQLNIADSPYPLFPIIDSPCFLENDTINSDIINIQVGDQISDVRMFLHLQIYPQ